MTRRVWTYRADIAFWALWLAAAGAFVGLAVWADHQYLLPLDRRVTFGTQDLDRYTWADRLFETVDGFADEGTITLVLFVAFAFLLVRGLRFEALLVAGAGAVRLLQLGVRAVIERPAGELIALRENADGLPQPQHLPDVSGFPSGHVLGAVIIYGLVFAYAPRALGFKPLALLVRAFCVFEIALIGPGRMYVGAHLFSDVVGAMLLAGIYLALAWKLDGMVSHIRAVAIERDLASDAGLSNATRGRRRFARAERTTTAGKPLLEDAQREAEPATR